MHVVVKSRWSSSFVFAMHIVVKISSLCSWSLCEGPSSPAIRKADASATVFVRPLDFTMHVVVKSRWSSSFVFAMYIVVKISSLCSWSLREVPSLPAIRKYVHNADHTSATVFGLAPRLLYCLPCAESSMESPHLDYCSNSCTERIKVSHSLSLHTIVAPTNLSLFSPCSHNPPKYDGALSLSPLRAVHIADDSDSDDGVTYFCENCDPCPVCLAPPKASPSQAATQATPPPSPVDGHRWPVPRAIPITVPFVIFLTEAYFLGGWKQLVLPYVIGTIVCLL
ncbi:hypothetical protein C8J57DRAFT_1511839 [Mycena rebaudengoi]|nr:hypothetical protein C8J57DRAFT_1511839 [Mycena rebaudengoi]